jgi:hypothetical protein
MKWLFYFSCFLLFLFAAGTGLAYTNEEFAYSIRMPDSYSQPTLVRVDLSTNVAEDMCKVPEMSNNMSIGQSGDVYIAQYMGIDTIGNTIVKYDANSRKINRLTQIITARGDGPLAVVPFKDYLYVFVYFVQRKSSHPQRFRSVALERYQYQNGQYVFKEDLEFGNDSYMVSSSLDVDRTNGKLYVATAFWVAPGNQRNQPTLYKIDLATGVIEKQVVVEACASPSGLVVTHNGKIYLGSTYQKAGVQYADKKFLSDYLCVFDAESLRFLKKIPIKSKLVRRLTYAPLENKIYAGYEGFPKAETYQAGIDVIDVTTDKVIKRITLDNFDRIEYAGQHKLLFTGRASGETEKHCLYILDTQKDEIIRKIPGMYVIVSRNFSDL